MGCVINPKSSNTGGKDTKKSATRLHHPIEKIIKPSQIDKSAAQLNFNKRYIS
jgi:hypothetical protein